MRSIRSIVVVLSLFVKEDLQKDELEPCGPFLTVQPMYKKIYQSKDKP